METLFRKSIGDSSKIRVLEFLIKARELNHSLSDIVEGSKIGRTTLFRLWPDLEESGVVKQTRQIGNAKLYKLNLKNPLVKKIVELFDEVIIPRKKLATSLTK